MRSRLSLSRSSSAMVWADGPFTCCWSSLRCSRITGSASRKIFKSASGKTFVPMSRPSITTPPPMPISRCRATIHSRTLGCTETRDAPSVTSRSRMRAETSFPLTSTRLPPMTRSRVMLDSCACFSSAGSSSNEASHSIARSASARYIAPLSRFTYPSLRASRDAIVLLPAPAGPSMAIISLRCDGSGIVAGMVTNVRFYTAQGWKTRLCGDGRLARPRRAKVASALCRR